MKKLFFTLCALCLCGTMWGQTYQDETTSLWYTLDGDNNATIVAPENGSYTVANLVDYTGDEATNALTLPATVGDNYPVVAVGAKAFQNALNDTENLIHLVIPANVTSFNGYGFQNCTQIQEVTVESGVSGSVLRENEGTSYDQAFSGCTNLKTVYDYRDITHGRGSSAIYYVHPFCGVPSIETVYIGEDVTQLTNNAFNALSSGNLSKVYCYATNPPSLATNCFEYKKEDCVLYVHSYSLESYQSNDSWVAIFGNNIKAMDEEEEEQPEGTLRDIDTGLYFDIDTDGVVSIVADASGVYTDSNLVKNDDGSYTLPSYVEDKGGTSGNVTRIDAIAFENSAISGHLVVPAHITKMGSQAFKGCTGLTEVTYEYSATQLSEEGDAFEYSFDGCSNVKTVNLNRDISLAHGNSSFCAPFTYQSYITTITIGENVTSIPHYMFRQGSTNTVLQTATSYAKTVPSLGSDPFGVTSATLYVPFGMSEAYTNAGWSTYFPTIVEMESTGLEEGTYLDIDTGLYFELNNDGTASIYYDEEGIYKNDNLIPHATITGAYTLPEKVSADGETYYNVTRVEADAFANSSISGHLVIPATIINMGERAFASCAGVTEVTYEYSSTALHEENRTNMSDGSFMSCSGVKTVNLYRDINYDSDVANMQCGPFRGVTSITEVNIGPRVTYIPSYIFRPAGGTNNISTINCYAAEPPSLGSIPFSTLPTAYTINVPQGSVSAYTTSWTDYSNFAEMSNAYAVNIYNVDADGDGYATFYDSKAVKLYGDVVAYTVSGVKVDEENNNAYVLMQELGDVIPAGTGALLEGDVAYYTAIEETAVSSETYSGDDYLLGFDEDGKTTVAPNNGDADDYYFYMLTLDSSNTSGTLAFYWGIEGGGVFTCTAHKAYLALDKNVVGTSNIKLKKGDSDAGDTTGISSVEASDGAKVSGIYTIQGVRVSSMSQPGLYIVDGKKVLVK